MKRVAIGLALIVAALQSMACGQKTEILTTLSPSKGRKVNVQRKLSSNQGTQIILTTTDLETGKVWTPRSPIYYEGVFDPYFDRYYPEHQWLAENVLWFGFRLTNASHSMIIENRTGLTKEYVEIRTEDLYFVFDMPANQRLILPLNWTDNKAKSVHFSVLAANSNLVEVSSGQFPFPRGASATYLILLEKDGPRISIESDR